MAPPTSSADKWGAAEGVAELRLRRGEREERIGPHFGGVVPLLFGVFCLVADMAFIGIKDLIVFLIKRAVKRAREKKAGASAPPETAA